MHNYIDILGEAEPIEQDAFQQIALLQTTPEGKALIAYLEMTIKRDLDSLMRVDPSKVGAVAQLQARIDANGQLRALITVDPSAYDPDENEEEEDG